MSDRERLKQAVCDAVDRHRDRVVGVGEAIMDEPDFQARRVTIAYLDEHPNLL